MMAAGKSKAYEGPPSIIKKKKHQQSPVMVMMAQSQNFQQTHQTFSPVKH